MKYVFIDIDGTLVTEDGVIPETALEVINKAKENGHKVFLCTGRNMGVSKFCQNLNLDGYITASGAYIVVHGKTIYENHIEHYHIDKLINEFNKTNIIHFVEGTSYIFCDEYGRSALTKLFENNERKDSIKNIRGIDEYNNDKILKFSIVSSDYNEIEDSLALYQDDFHCCTSTFSVKEIPYLGQFTKKGDNKFEAIKKVMQYYNHNIEDAIAIGDSGNDLEMIEGCKVSVAMGNATELIKQKATFITTDVDKDGLYNAFKYLELI